jgi:lysophospholipase L1-like esterase
MRISNRAFIPLAALLSSLVFPALRAAELDPTRWEKEIAAFEASDRTNPPPKGAVLFVGSSSIRLWKNLPTDFPDLKVVQRGFGGSHISDLTHFADRIVIPYQPSKIVIYEGDNDIGAGRNANQVYDDFRALVKKLRAALPKAKIYYLAIKPSPSRWHLSPQSSQANQLIRRYARSHQNVEYIDVWTPILGPNRQPDPALFERDNLHLNRKGYERWISVVRNALRG